MHKQFGKPGKVVLGAVFLSAVFLLTPAAAAEKEKAHDLGQVEITGEKENQQVVIEPQKSIIRLEDYESIGVPQNVGEIVRDQVIIDYRGGTRLVPDDDTLYMRGFSSKRFVTALDGSTIRKTGGRRGSHIVDYALLPPFLIDTVEVLPGPHSALYPGKAIGGVVDFKTRAPVRHDTLKPDVSVTTSYGTYNTENHNINLQGSAGDVTYDLGYQKYATDGYLRHNEADFDTFFGRLGYILPNKGYITFTASYADIERERPVNNAPGDPDSNYDSDYPVVNGEDVSRGGFYDWQDPTWDKVSPNYRMDLKIPSAFGIWRANAYYGEEDRDNARWEWVDSRDPSQGIYYDSWVTEWQNQGGKISNEFQLAEGHVTTLGMDLVQCYDGHEEDGGADNKRIENIAGFFQHEWRILPRLTLTAGLRYTDNTIWVDNTDDGGYDITGPYEGEDDIERSWSQWLPKSFLTYEMDDLADLLRDTSVSVGVSRIWRSPDYHGDYNPQGKPTGAWLDPEHGVGYDLVFNRRLAGDINLKINYAYYEIEDFMAGNADPEYGNNARGGTIPAYVRPGEEWKDYHVNLEEIDREGFEIQLSGHLTDKLYMLVGWAWQDFEYDGDKYEASAKEEIDERPENLVKAKLTYQVFEGTSVTVDYEYQDEQVVEEVNPISEDVYEIYRTKIDAFSLVGLSIKHRLFEEWNGIRQGMIELYANNLFDEDYLNTSAYPGTDLTVGSAISFQF